MGMANKAPMDHYTRTYYVAQHAIERLRERIGDKHSLTHRSDTDLGNALDDATKNAVTAGFVVQRKYDGKSQRVADVSTHFGFSLRAVIAKNDKTGTSCHEAIVTILTETTPLGRSLGSLGDLIPAEDVQRMRKDAPEAPAPPPQPPPPATRRVVSRDTFDLMIGRLDRMLSEFLSVAREAQLDELDRQTIKHHADDLIGVGKAALEALGKG